MPSDIPKFNAACIQTKAIDEEMDHVTLEVQLQEPIRDRSGPEKVPSCFTYLKWTVPAGMFQCRQKYTIEIKQEQ